MYIRVENILTGLSERDKILYSSSDFVILPDMKWDLKTITSLYLMAIVKDGSIRSLRDLRRGHLGLLKSIREEAYKIVQEKWGLGPGSLRMHVHYQPSYCSYCLYLCRWIPSELQYMSLTNFRSFPRSHRKRQLCGEHTWVNCWSGTSFRRRDIYGQYYVVITYYPLTNLTQFIPL